MIYTNICQRGYQHVPHAIPLDSHTIWTDKWQEDLLTDFLPNILWKLQQTSRPTYFKRTHSHISYQIHLTRYMNKTNIFKSNLLTYFLANIFQTLQDLDQHTRRGTIYRFLVQYLSKTTGSRSTDLMSNYSQLPYHFFSKATCVRPTYFKSSYFLA